MRRGALKALTTTVAVAAAATGVAACGSSGGSASGNSGGSASTSSGGQAASSDPQTLLKQTFSSAKTVKSGKLDFKLLLTPTGSSLITSPVTVDLSGPFVQGTKGQTPRSDLTISFDGLGKHASFGVVTTTSAAYISLQGSSYKLPNSDFQQLKKSTSSSQSTGGLPGLGALGINPESWLDNPKIVGDETIGGTDTKHLSATLDVARVLGDVNTLLSKDASKLNVPAGTDHISQAEIEKISREIKNPTMDVWTGKRDAILRRLTLGATVPVSGTTSTQLGGLTSAGIKLSVDVSGVNQPQTINAPSDPKSYAQLQTALQGVLGGLGLSGVGGATGSSSSGGGSTSSASPAQLKKYSTCINRASGDVSKMQKCASLLNGG